MNPEIGAFPTCLPSEQHVLDFSVPRQTSAPAAPHDNPPDPGSPAAQHETVRSEIPARKDASVNIPPVRKPPKTVICWDIEHFDEDVEKDYGADASYTPQDYGTPKTQKDAAMMDSTSANHIPAILGNGTAQSGNFPKPSVALYMPPPPPVAMMVPAKVLNGPNRPPPSTLEDAAIVRYMPLPPPAAVMVPAKVLHRPPPPPLQDAAVVSYMPQVRLESKPADVRIKRKQTAPIYIPPRRRSEVPPRMREVAPDMCKVPSRRREVPPRMKRASTNTSAPKPPVPSPPTRRGQNCEQPTKKTGKV